MSDKKFIARLFVRDEKGRLDCIGFADRVDVIPMEDIFEVTDDGGTPIKTVRVHKYDDYVFCMAKGVNKRTGEDIPEPVPTVESKDMVNHPPHYTRDGAMECIDEMVMLFGPDAVMRYCLCNAWKYRYRAADKNGEEDIKKSDWYIAKYKELRGTLRAGDMR